MVNGITTDSIPFQEQPNADHVTAENVPSLPTPQQLTVEEMDQSSAEIPTGSPQSVLALSCINLASSFSLSCKRLLLLKLARR